MSQTDKGGFMMRRINPENRWCEHCDQCEDRCPRCARVTEMLNAGTYITIVVHVVCAVLAMNGRAVYTAQLAADDMLSDMSKSPLWIVGHLIVAMIFVYSWFVPRHAKCLSWAYSWSAAMFVIWGGVLGAWALQTHTPEVSLLGPFLAGAVGLGNGVIAHVWANRELDEE